MIKAQTFRFFILAVSVSLFSFSIQQFSLKESIKRGEEVYKVNCEHCHMDDGSGIEALIPPLEKAGHLTTDKERAIKQLLFGVSEPITIDGIKYTGAMPSQDMLTDKEIADVLNFVRNSWGHTAEAILPSEVTNLR